MLLDFDSSNDPYVASPPTRAHFILGLMFPLLIIALLFVFMRVSVKAKLGKLGVEDVFIVFASVSYSDRATDRGNYTDHFRVELCSCVVGFNKNWYVNAIPG